MSEAAPADDGAMNVEAAEEALPSGEEEFDEPSAEDSDADSSNEEDEAEDEFEEDGFVVDEAEEGEEEEDSIKKRKKKKRVREYVPDEDDLDLLEEHGVVLKRQKPGRRRLQQAGDAQHMAANANEMQDELFLADDLLDELEDHDELSSGGKDEDDVRPKPDPRGKPKDSRSKKSPPNNQSRPEGRGTRGERAGSRGAPSRGDFNDDDFVSDEMGDFIVEEGDEAARRKRASKAAVATGLSARALEEAQDIFGDVEGLIKMYQEARGRPSAVDDDEDEGEELDEDVEDLEDEMELEDLDNEVEALDDQAGREEAVVVEGQEGAAAPPPPPKPKKDPAAIEAKRQALEEKRATLEAKRKLDQEMRAARREAKNKKMQYEKILKAIGPEAVASMYLRPEDEKIKETDWPERLQVAQNLLATGKHLKVEGRDVNHAAAQEGGAPVIDIESAAEWIYEDLFGQSSSSVAKDIVEAGVVEVDASSVPFMSQQGSQQQEGRAVWKMQDLITPPHLSASAHDMMQLNSFRAVRKPRTETLKQMWRRNESSQASLREAVRQALVHIYEKGEEVPLIGLYRKELVGELLSMREEDAPSLASQGDLAYPPATVPPRGTRVRRFEVLWSTYVSSLRFQRAAGKQAALMAKLDEALSLLPRAPEEVGEGSQPSSQGWDERVEGDRNVIEDLKKRLVGGNFNPPKAKGWVPNDEAMGDIEARLKLIMMGRQSLSILSATASQSSQGAPTSRHSHHKAPAHGSVISYRQACDAGLPALVSAVLLTPEQYAENVEDPESQPNEPLDPGGHLSPFDWFQKQLEEKSALRELVAASAGTVCDEIKAYKVALEKHQETVLALQDNEGASALPPPPPPAPFTSDLLTTAAYGTLIAIHSKSPSLTPDLRAIGAAALARRFKTFAAQQLAAEPDIRVTARAFYLNHAKVTTRPTASGQHHPSLDPWAKYGIVKNLVKKPLKNFLDASQSKVIRDRFLRLRAAEKEGLITVTIQCEIPPHDELVRVYQSTNVSATAKAWNEFRVECLKAVLTDYIFPSILNEVTQSAMALAREAALSDYKSKLWSIVTRPPLKLAGGAGGGDDGEGGEVDHPRVMSAVWGPGERQPTILVLLEEQGALVDIVPCGQLSGHIPKSGQSFRDVFNDDKKSKDIRRIKDRLLQKGTPHAILVGVSTLGGVNTSQLHEDLTRVCEFIFDEHAREIRETLETGLIEVRYADERLAALWEGCKAAREEFPDQPTHVRRAIALGRLALDPLSVLSQLCSPTGREILSFKTTELQDLLSPDELLMAVEQVMVSAVAQVGVDVNLAANVTWRKDLLQFVPGLGPRKARALIEAMIKTGGAVDSRNVMFRELPKKPLGKTVFRNCGGCLRVSNAGLPQLVNRDFFALDGTRIHPESYRLAVAVVESATGEGDVEAAIEEASDKIERVDLVEICRSKDLALSSKLATLIDIRHELLSPAGELRGTGGVLSDREVFLLQFGESEETLREGKLLEARVVFVGRDEVKCRLTSSPIEAVIRKENFTSSASSRTERFDLRDVVKKDDVLTGRIVALRIEESQRDGSKHHVIELTTKSSDLGNLKKYEEKYCTVYDSFFKFTIDLENLAQADSAAAAQGFAATPSASGVASSVTGASPSTKGDDKNFMVVQRPIVHPLFRNCNYVNAAVELQNAKAGSCIIRPASGSKGAIMLSLSIKTYSPSERPSGYQHGFQENLGPIVHSLNVVELGKKPGVAAHLQLVTPLQMDLKPCGAVDVKLQFEDLDEIHVSFVEPLVAQITRVVKHPKFLGMRKADIDAKILADKRMNPSGLIPYAIGIEVDKGRTFDGVTTVFDGVRFYISFAFGTTIHHEHFFVSHQGLSFRSKSYRRLDEVIAAFKTDPMFGRSKGVHGRPDMSTPHAPLPAAHLAAPPTAMSRPYPQSYPTPGGPLPLPHNPPRPTPVAAYSGTPMFPPPPSFSGPPPGWSNIHNPGAGPPPGWSGLPQQPPLHQHHPGGGFPGFQVPQPGIQHPHQAYSSYPQQQQGTYLQQR